jgi:hypothetical protein
LRGIDALKIAMRGEEKRRPDRRAAGARPSYPAEHVERTPAFDYFNEVLTELKTELRLVPIPLTAAIIAIAIPAAIRPYSMAVAPDSFVRNVKSMFFMDSASHVTFQQEPASFGQAPVLLTKNS